MWELFPRVCPMCSKMKISWNLKKCPEMVSFNMKPCRFWERKHFLWHPELYQKTAAFLSLLFVASSLEPRRPQSLHPPRLVECSRWIFKTRGHPEKSSRNNGAFYMAGNYLLDKVKGPGVGVGTPFFLRTYFRSCWGRCDDARIKPSKSHHADLSLAFIGLKRWYVFFPRRRRSFQAYLETDYPWASMARPSPSGVLHVSTEPVNLSETRVYQYLHFGVPHEP